VFRGRFSPGGQTILYDAAWEGAPLDVFETAIGSRDARERGLAPAALFDVSPSGDIAIGQATRAQLRYLRIGRLALATASGSPRPLGNQVAAADWTPDGRELVVARREGAEWLIEWPLGQVFHRTPNTVFDLRVSPSGDRVAWLERATAGNNVDVTVADRRGKPRVIAQAGPSPGGLAWARTGAEVWFTSAKTATLGDLELRAVTLDGQSRVVLDVPGGLRLLDVAHDGRVLVSRVSEASELFVEEGGTQRGVGWRSSSTLRDLSDDGRQVLFSEDGPGGFDLFLRPTSGGPAVRLASGVTYDQARLSPDSSRIALRDGDQVRLIPVGPGNIVNVGAAGQVYGWSADNRRLLLWGLNDRGGRPALRPIDTAGAEEIVEGLVCVDRPVLSTTRTEVACGTSNGSIAVHSLEAGTTRHVTPATELGGLIGWSSNGRELFSFTRGAPPQAIRSLDLASGRVSIAREVKVLDATGVWRVGQVAITADRRVVAYSLFRQLDELYVYTGLR
jgi:dipeptidyl aminopeptidase/acylaminoacyl peptidase